MKKKKSQEDRNMERKLDALLLSGAIDKAVPFDLRKMPDEVCPLSIAEFFATKRAARVPEKIHALWKALSTIEPQTIPAPSEIYAAVYDGTISKDQYEKHMARRIAVANKGF